MPAKNWNMQAGWQPGSFNWEAPCSQSGDWEKLPFAAIFRRKILLTLNSSSKTSLPNVAPSSVIRKYATFAKGKDYETFSISRKILHQELDHEQDWEDYLKDINSGAKYAKEPQPGNNAE